MDEVTAASGVIVWLKTWIPVITQVVGSFALIATVTPNKSDNVVFQIALELLNFMGGNFGKASNKEAGNLAMKVERNV